MAGSRPKAGTPLSEREHEVARHYAEGRSHKEIARTLDIAPSTIRTHLNAVYRKLEVSNRIGLLRRLSGCMPTSWDLQTPSLSTRVERRIEVAALSGLSPMPTVWTDVCTIVPPGIAKTPEPLDADLLDRRLRLIQAVADGSFDAAPALEDLPRFKISGNQAETAETHFAAVGGYRIAYREMGENCFDAVPIVFLNRFRASMDDWDPALVNAVAKDRRVILVDGVGVGESDGRAPASLERAADDLLDFFRVLGLRIVDILGWSLGGMTAQILAIKYPGIVRKLALIGTLPPGGSSDIVVIRDKWVAVATQPAFTEEDLLYLFFSPSPEGMAAGRASLQRISFRRDATEIKTRFSTMLAQLQAATSFFGDEKNWYEKIKSIQAPTLVANGDHDPVFPVIDSVILADAIPLGRLALYPDSGHGFQFQYPDRFATDLGAFLQH